MQCSNQYINFVPGCASEIVVNTTLDEEETYKVRLKYPNGFILTIASLEPNEAGNIVIANNGYWHNGTGDVMLQLFAGNNCDPVEFSHCDRIYSSVLLSFINESILPEQATHTIFCDCQETDG